MRIGLIGKGKMCSLIASQAKAQGHDVLFLADAFDKQPLWDNIANTDVLIDFSHPDNLDWVLEAIRDQNLSLVIGTTGYSAEQKKQIEELSDRLPVFFAANYSLGVALLQTLAAKAAEVLEGWDIEIVEKHHNQKVDAPSGTALALADSVDPAHAHERVYGRSGHTGARGSEIGIHAVRGGSVAGDHDVYFFGPSETVTLSHHAQNREIFVHGALKAAEFISKAQKPGLYNMQDLLAQ